MDRLLDSFLNPDVMRASIPFLVRGFWMTVRLCALVIPLGVLAGLVLVVHPQSVPHIPRRMPLGDV